jgi:hypothetical protein
LVATVAKVAWLVAKLASVACDGCEDGVGWLRWLQRWNWTVVTAWKAGAFAAVSNWVYPELISKVMVFNAIFYDCL